jgi:ferric-dicitrate binding protein FerR (iron transport regulator)
MVALLAALLIGSADPVAAAGEGKLAIAQGTIEAKGSADADFKALKPGDPIDAGMTLRSTPGARAAIDFGDGTELRVDENTELSLLEARKMELKKGRIHLRITNSPKRFEIETQHIGINAAAAVVDITFVPRVENGAPAGTTVRCLDGTANVISKKFKANLFAGFWCASAGQLLMTPDPAKNGSLDTAWVHPLLAERGRADEEVANRMMDLIAILSKEKPNDPVEAALRPLGDLATPELARYLARPLHPAHAERRAAAARIIAETGTMKSAAALVTLLQHSEPEVRVIAARGLARLNGGKDLGFGESVWKGEALDAGRKAWETWLKQNSKP